MKILFLTEFFPVVNNGKIPGGSESRTYYLAKQLVKNGHLVTVLTANLLNTKKEEIWDGVRVIRIGPKYSYVQSGSNFSRLGFALSLIPEGLRLDYDVVDANNSACYVAGWLVARLKLKKLVYWVPDILGLTGWIKALGLINGSINYINESWSLFIGASKYIALSEVTKKKLINWGIDKKKIKVIYPGLAKISEAKNAKIIKQIVSVNRLVKYKETDVVIKALIELRTRKINLKYRIIGDGSERKYLEKLVKDNNLKNIKFLGYLPNEKALKIIEESQLFCLASAVEGFGIVTMEAAGMGTPFVNSDIDVHEEIKRNSNAGLLFKLHDHIDLADKIENLIKDSKKYRQLCINANAFAKKHGLEQATKDYENLLSH